MRARLCSLALPALVALLLVVSCARLVSVVGLAWDRLPYVPESRSGATLVALPLAWCFANQSSAVARSFYSTLPVHAPALNASYLLVGFGGETAAQGNVNELFITPYPPSIMPQSKMQFVRPVATGRGPMQRQQHSAALIPNRMPATMQPPHVHYTAGWMVLFGGADEAREMNSVWLYDLNINQWVGLGPYPDATSLRTELTNPLPPATSLIDLGKPEASALLPDGVAGLVDHVQDWAGCAWPAPRSQSSLVLIEVPDRSPGAAANATALHLVLTFGSFRGDSAASFRVWGDLWTLRVDSADFYSVLNEQAQSLEGDFVRNASAPCVGWVQRQSSNASSLDPLRFPPPRYGHAVVSVDADESLFVFGGATTSQLFSAFLDDLWRYSMRDFSWARIDPAAATGAPGPMAYATLLLVDQMLMLWLGSLPALLPSESLYAFNLTTLHAVSAGSASPVISCAECWSAFNNSLISDASMPILRDQISRGPAVTVPLRMQDGSRHAVAYGGLTSLQMSDIIYVLAVAPGTEQQQPQPDLLLSALYPSPLPYYANSVDGCANLTTSPLSSSVSRQGAPEARAYHAGAATDDVLYIFAGSVGLGQAQQPLNDFWSYEPAMDRWTLLGSGDENGRRVGNPSQAWPLPRTGPAMDLWYRDNDVNRPTLIMQGGGRVGHPFFADVWLYDIVADEWTEQSTTVNSTAPFRGRYGHYTDIFATGGSASDTGQMFCSFGGAVNVTTAYQCTNEVWCLDLQSWTWNLLFEEHMQTGGLYPEPTLGMVGSTVPAVITSEWDHAPQQTHSTQFIVGNGGSFQTFTVAYWTFDLPSRQWSLTQHSGAPPSARFFSACALIQNRLYVWAGFDSGPRQDMYEFDLHMRVWSQMGVQELFSGTTPAARTGSVGIAMPRRSIMAVFSGQSNPWTNDLHLFTVDAPTLHQVSEPLSSNSDDSAIPEVSGHDILALLVPYLSMPAPSSPLLSFATLAASVNYFQSIQAQYVQYFISGASQAASGDAGYSPFTRRLATVTFTAPSLFRGVLRGLSSPAPMDQFPLLDCGGSSCFRVRTLDPAHFVEFESLHVVNARGFSGAAFFVDASSVAFSFVVLEGHHALERGAAIAANASNVFLSSSRISGCSSGVIGGAVYVSDSNLTLLNTSFTANAIVFTGSNTSSLPPSSSVAVDSSLQGYGGAVFTLASRLFVNGSLFFNNSVDRGWGGAIAAVSIAASVGTSSAAALLNAIAVVQVADSNFTSNAAEGGGAILQSNFIQSATASAADGGPPDPPPSSASYLNPQPPRIYSHYWNNSFTANTARTGSGGAIYLDACTGVELSGGDFRSNQASSAAGGGGVLYWNLDPQLLDSGVKLAAAAPSWTPLATFEDNTAAYGPDLASPPVALQFEDLSASLLPQISAALLSPPPALSLRDYWNQVVLVDSESFVSAGPSTILSGDIVVRVHRGVANFTELRLILLPTTSAAVTFASSLHLPLSAQATQAGNMSLNLTSAVCAAGQYLPGGFAHPLGTPQCLDCPAGSYSPSSAVAMSGVCHPCQPGYFQNSTRATSCFQCAIGTFNPSTGLAALAGCPPCPSGAFSFNAGASSCLNCGTGLECGNLAAFADAGRWIVEETALTPVVDPDAVERPLSTSAAAESSLFDSSSNQSFVLTVTRVYTISCPGENCVAGGMCGHNRLNPASANVLCGACVGPDYSELNGKCTRCESANGGLIFLLVLIGFGFVAILHRLSRGGSSNADLHILTYFTQSILFQCSAQVGPWLDWMAFFDLSPKRLVGATGGSGSAGICLWPTNSFGELAIDLFTPLVLLAMLGVIMTVHWVLSACASRDEGASTLAKMLPRWHDLRATSELPAPEDKQVALHELSVSVAAADRGVDEPAGRTASDAAAAESSAAAAKAARIAASPLTLSRVSTFDSYIRTSHSLLLFIYQPLSSTILNHLNCVDVGGGHRVVFVSPTMDCASSVYHGWQAALILGVILLIVGAPLGITLWLYKHRDLIRLSDADRAAEAAAVLAAQAHARAGTVAPVIVREISAESHAAAAFSRRYGVLFQAYTLRSGLGYLYHAFVLVRRLLFVVLSVALFTDPATRLTCWALWNLAILQVHLSMQPFHRREHNRMEGLTLAALTVASMMLVPQASRDITQPVSVPVQILLGLIILPLTLVLVMRLISAAARKHCGRRCCGGRCADATDGDAEEEAAIAVQMQKEQHTEAQQAQVAAAAALSASSHRGVAPLPVYGTATPPSESDAALQPNPLSVASSRSVLSLSSQLRGLESPSRADLASPLMNH